MGALNFLKSIFTVEKLEEDSVSLDNLEEWFKEKSSAKYDFLNGQILGINTKIGEDVEKLKESIEKLRNAELRNPNIPERAKHFMEGNRETYIKYALLFIEKLSLPENVDNLNEFFSDFSKKLEEFGKITARPYHILKEFLEDEASAVAACIRSIELNVHGMKEQRKNAKISDLETALKLIKSLNEKIQRKEELAKEIEEKNKVFDLSKKDIEKMEAELAKMKASDDFNDYNASKKELEEITAKVKEKESEIIHPFSVLERPLRKFERSVVTDKDILDAYMKSPITGITQDFDLRIVSIMSNMKKAVMDNTLELKDKQKEIAIREIGILNKDFLGKFQMEYGKIKKHENGIRHKISSFDIIERISKADENLKIKKSMLKNMEHVIQKAEDELKSININVMKTAVKEKIKDGLKVKLEISEN